ncbi:MAG: haloacid dehalogenase [Chloroflexota bacterium]
MDQIAESIRCNFDQKSVARERGLSLSRGVIRSSANAIRAIHRGEFEEAQRLIASARDAVSEAVDALEHHPDILYAGFIQDAQKEYAEANITYAIIVGEELPSPEDLGVGYAAYLNGLGEAAGELRRYALDELRRGHLARSEEVLQAMDDIYGVLVTMDYPDAMTGGLRRTTDMVRGVLEKTRGDLTVAVRQRELEVALHDLENKLGRGKGRSGN